MARQLLIKHGGMYGVGEYTKAHQVGGIALAGIIVLIIVWPFYSVPTGSRGVVTRFGASSASKARI